MNDTMKATEIKLAPPWVTYQKELEVMFRGDPDIKINNIYPSWSGQTDDGDYMLDIMVKNHNKCVELSKLLPEKVSFGNVKLRVTVYDMENETNESDIFASVKTVFEGNPHISRIEVLSDFAGTYHCFVIFKAEVLQFHNDNTGDINGNWSGLAQDIAKEVMNVSPFIHFCTETIE